MLVYFYSVNVKSILPLKPVCRGKRGSLTSKLRKVLLPLRRGCSPARKRGTRQRDSLNVGKEIRSKRKEYSKKNLIGSANAPYLVSLHKQALSAT